MEPTTEGLPGKPKLKSAKTKTCCIDFKRLRISLRRRPDIIRLVLALHICVKKKNKIISRLKTRLKKLKKKTEASKGCDFASQTDEKCFLNENNNSKDKDEPAWNTSGNGEAEKSIAEQVTEAAQSALAETGMVYIETAGMYYDYKTGYYYSSDLGLYYHPTTGCYYRYSEETKNFEFHSYADTNNFNRIQKQHKKEKAKKNKKDKEENENDITHKRRMISHQNTKKAEPSEKSQKDIKKSPQKIENETHIDDNEKSANKKVNSSKNNSEKSPISTENSGITEKNSISAKCADSVNLKNETNFEDLEEGECSESDEESDASTVSVSDDDTLANHHPPCMRIIVRDTKLSKLKVGTLFLITKDGGTVGREGKNHTVLIKDCNLSRNHLEIRYDIARNCYIAMDLGSKNGTTLNGSRMSESQEVSTPMEVPHGSIIEIGETKLLCHIHPGTNTCGHCEPGLVMEAEESTKPVAYTRTCSVQKQYQLELARLKNKYVPEPLAIEDGSYNDRAKARREKVGSTHDAEKTQQSDLETSIASDNKGFQMLSKMGWAKGTGLGKDGQGDTEPVPLVNNESKVGLGAVGSAAPVLVQPAGLAGAARPIKITGKRQLLKPPARAFLDPLEEDDDN